MTTSRSSESASPQTRGGIEVKRAFTTREAANYIGRSSSWLRKKRLRGPADPTDAGPKFVKTPSGTVIYLREALDKYLDQLAADSDTHHEPAAPHERDTQAA
ncbi:MAG TPA: hypothetical protein VFR18_00160 [Terriglobia bacterium]|nr:hypothetical protein [Terriglobia bacterium]